MTNFTGENFYTQPPAVLPTDASDDELVASLKVLYKKIVELGYALELTSSTDTLDTAQYLQEVGKLNSFTKAFGASGSVPSAAVSLRQGQPPRRVTFTMKAPATLWGRQWLGMQQYLHTDHDLMIAMAYLRQCGRSATVHTKVDSNSFSREFVLL